MIKNKEHDFIEDNIIILSKQTLDLFLAQEKPADLISLYTFYYYTAKWQKTNQIKAATSFVCKALNWSKDKTLNNKKILLDFGLVSDIKQVNPKTGKITGWYIKVNYIWKNNTIKNKITDSSGEAETTPPKITTFPQTTGVVFPPSGNQDTNALSANNINALSANNNKGNFINEINSCKEPLNNGGGVESKAVNEIIALMSPLFEMDFSGGRNPYKNNTIRGLVETAIKIKTLKGLKKMIADFATHRKDQFIPKPSTMVDFFQYKFYGIDAHLNQKPANYGTKNIPGSEPGEFNRTHKEFLDRVKKQEWDTNRRFYKNNKDKLDLSTYYKNNRDKYDLDNLDDVE